MSVSHAPALGAIAFQLMAALDAYELEVEEMLRAPGDAELYRRVSNRMNEMRLYIAPLPALSVPWVEVLIRHFELTHAMWRSLQPGAPAPDLASLHEQLRASVQQLSRRCAMCLPNQ